MFNFADQMRMEGEKRKKAKQQRQQQEQQQQQQMKQQQSEVEDSELVSEKKYLKCRESLTFLLLGF